MLNYYLKDDIIDPAWVDAHAEAAARSFFTDNKSRLAASQLRKFYGDVKALERQWQNGGGDEAAFAEVLPLVKLLKAKSSYACKCNVVPENFRKWLCDHVDSVNSARDFRVFVLHFEAVVGFSYGCTPDKSFN